MITLHGVETNNLKGIDAVFPHGKITAIVGGSGAGKTSLAFHTLYALCKNEMDTISGIAPSLRPVVRGYANLLPAIALRQKNTNVNPRSSIFTYLGMDKLFLPLFLRANPDMKGNALAQNTPTNYCPVCQGLGVIHCPDVGRIVDVDTPLNARPFLSWNKFLSTHYYPLLEQFCAVHGVDMSRTLTQLPAAQSEMLLHSPGTGVFLVKYKQKTRYRQKKYPFIGAIREIQQCCDNIQQPGNRQKAKSYIIERICPQCGGVRFAPQLRQYALYGWAIQDIMAASFSCLIPFLRTLPASDFAVKKLTDLAEQMVKNNLGYLTPMRSIPSLSGGEFQRLQLGAILSADFCSLLYVVDEAAASLHVAEYANVMNQIVALKKKSATIVMVEHKLAFIEHADAVIAMDNGQTVDAASWLQGQRDVSITRVKAPPKGSMQFSVSNVHNIRQLDITIPMGCLVGCCGVSGSGKSSFAEAISTRNDVTYISQSGIHGNSNSTVGTYLKLMQPIDSFLCQALHTPLKTFLFNYEKSQCPVCAGKGYIEQEATFGHSYRYSCDTCDGKRYNAEVLKYTFQVFSIYDILTLTVSQLLEEGLFSGNATIKSKLKDMQAIGLGHLTLFRPTAELSGGEAQRVKLLSQIKSNLKNKFLIVDEPSRGLERNDSRLLLDYLDVLLPSTKGIMVIEHNVFLLKHMDYIVEFGPGGGSSGGKVIFTGFVEDIYKSNSILKDHI